MVESDLLPQHSLIGLVRKRENRHRKPYGCSHELWCFPVNLPLNHPVILQIFVAPPRRPRAQVDARRSTRLTKLPPYLHITVERRQRAGHVWRCCIDINSIWFTWHVMNYNYIYIYIHLCCIYNDMYIYIYINIWYDILIYDIILLSYQYPCIYTV